MPLNKQSTSYTRYSFGSIKMQHKNKYTTTSVGSEYDLFVRTLHSRNSKRGKVPAMVAYRPDLISNIFYNSPGYWWYIMQYNGITDPFEELGPGKPISIPDL